jgi:predicted enzyme related to lactoylglutathione lyase
MVGLQEVVVSVFEVGRVANAFVRAAGYSCTDLPDAPRSQFEPWRVPDRCDRIEQCLLSAPGDDRGHLRLVRFHGVDHQLIRPSPKMWNTGGFAGMDVWSKDAVALSTRLQRDHGWVAVGEHVDYTMDEFEFREVVLTGPDGVMLSILEPRAAGDFDSGFDYLTASRVFNVGSPVRDLDAATTFFRDVLGWNEAFVKSVQGTPEPGIEIWGMPPPHGIRSRRELRMYYPATHADGVSEILNIVGMDGHDYSDRAIAPNVGPLVARFLVDDAAAYAEDISARGGELYAPLSRLEIAPYGECSAFTIQAPFGSLYEFLSR